MRMSELDRLTQRINAANSELYPTHLGKKWLLSLVVTYGAALLMAIISAIQTPIHEERTFFYVFMVGRVLWGFFIYDLGYRKQSSFVLLMVAIVFPIELIQALIAMLPLGTIEGFMLNPLLNVCQFGLFGTQIWFWINTVRYRKEILDIKKQKSGNLFP